jgi:hypothetical protein
MPARLVRPVAIIAAAVLLLVIAAAAMTFHSADAQTTVPITAVFSNVPASASNGTVNLNNVFGEPTGSDAGIVGVQCQGANPLGGPTVPGFAVTHLFADRTQARFASWGTGTPVINGTINGTFQINCTFYFGDVTVGLQFSQRAKQVQQGR